MRMRYFSFPSLIVFAAVFALPVTAAFAQSTEPPKTEQTAKKPPAKDPKVELEELFTKLKKQSKASAANATEQQIWKLWNKSGNYAIDSLMEWATLAMRDKRFVIAQDMLDQVIALEPDYSEAWNRRATMFYQMKDFSKSISDIEQTLRLEPRHFGALSGLGTILQSMDQKEKALETWYKVLEIYPASQAAQKAVISLEEKLAGERT